MLTHFTSLIESSWRYSTGLHAFLKETIDLEGARRFLIQELEQREEAFLEVLERGIYANPRSPYHRLLQHAGYELADVQALVRSQGLEDALAQLHDKGVYVTLEEFKGRAPIRRPGLEFPVEAHDFSNPLLTVHYAASTGGSRGKASPVEIDLDFLADDAANSLWGLHATGFLGRPVLLRAPGAPSLTALRTMLQQAKQDRVTEKWLSPTKPNWNRQSLQGRVLYAITRLVARRAGKRMPRPEYAPDSMQAVNYLAEYVRNGTPALQQGGGVTQVIRTCLAAERSGLDISGTAFRGGSEPTTEGKLAVVKRVGAVLAANYAMQEAGNIACGCGNPSAPDDMHFLKGKLAVVQRPIRFEGGGLAVDGLFYTTLSSRAPRMMLNVESGDYAVLEERDCGCAWQSIGLTTHIHHVRSYEKLTSGGVTFMGSMLHELLEQTLPARFGGSPLDYQLVEEEEDGITRVSVLVSPRLGAVDEAAVVDAVLRHLGFADWSRRQADLWRQNRTLRVQRREPYATRAGKILPLHVLDTGTEVNSG
jgi:hypothetical protein